MMWILLAWVVLSIPTGLITARFIQGCEDNANDR